VMSCAALILTVDTGSMIEVSSMPPTKGLHYHNCIV